MIHTWKITKTISDEIHFDDESSLDAITRQLPDGFYSTFRTYDSCTRVIGLSAHLKRLPNTYASFLRRQLLLLIEPYRPDEARVRVMESRGGQIYISIEPLKLLQREVYEKGVKVETTSIQRNDPRVKSTSFIAKSDEERKYLAKEKIFEALLVKNGKILEGMTSNFFYVPTLRAPENHRDYSERSDEWSSRSADEAHGFMQHHASSTGLTSISPSAQREVIYTARNDILLGITRTMVIHAARGRGVDVRYRPLRLNQLSIVREAFITSSSRGVVPVIQIDEAQVGKGRPGNVTKLLMAAYDKYVLKHAEKI